MTANFFYGRRAAHLMFQLFEFPLLYFNISGGFFLMLENRCFLSELCLKTVKTFHFDKLFFAALRKIEKNERFSGLFSLFSTNITKVENPFYT